MCFNGWIAGCKVQIMPWVDGKTIYVNVQYYKNGQSLSQPPVWDKTVYITDDEKGRDMIKNCLHSLVMYISQKVWLEDGQKMVITVS